MKTAFLCWGVAIFALALAMVKGLDREARSPIGTVLFIIASVGIVVSGLFDCDLMVLNENPPPRWVEPPSSGEGVVHNLGGLAAFFAIMPGAGLVSRRLRRTGRLQGRYRWLRYLSWLTPLAFIAFALVFTSIGLAGLGQRWNISMFHYRNHGAAYGRILVGVQVPGNERRAFEQVLDEINYRHWEETENCAYQLYLGRRAE